MMIKQKILADLREVLEGLGFPTENLTLTLLMNNKFGDYSTNFPLQLVKQVSLKEHYLPLEVAKKVAGKFSGVAGKFSGVAGKASKVAGKASKIGYLEKVEVKEPGFINFFIKPEFLAKDLEEILKQGKNFGKSTSGKGKRARVEFVSANPTGPLHFGNARGGPIGDTLCNVLRFCGWEVLREYLDNDRGNQILELGKTLTVRAGLISIPEEELAYKGEYTKELAHKVKTGLEDVKWLTEDQIIAKFGEAGVKILFQEAIADSEALGIKFDYIVHEGDLQKKAPVILDELEKKGVLKKYDGAVWFAPKSEYLKDKEAVVVKSNGEFTYFAADIVYHLEKFTSGYDLVIDVFGSNTSGHVPKLQALAEISDFDLAKFVVIMYQFVRVKRGKEIVKMSKRAGNFVTAREVLDEVGRDAFRFFVLMHDVNTHMDFDLERAKEQSNKNPVFYVQYAHARMSNILRKATLRLRSGRAGNPSTSLRAGRQPFDFTQGGQATANYGLLSQKEELELIKHLCKLPDLIEEIAQNYQVQYLTVYAITLADLFHKFYENCRVLDAETEELKAARLDLVLAGKIVLANTLDIMGVSAPERM